MVKRMVMIRSKSGYDASHDSPFHLDDDQQTDSGTDVAGVAVHPRQDVHDGLAKKDQYMVYTVISYSIHGDQLQYTQ